MRTTLHAIQCESGEATPLNKQDIVLIFTIRLQSALQARGSAEPVCPTISRNLMNSREQSYSIIEWRR